MVAATRVSICPGGVEVDIGVAAADWQEAATIIRIDKIERVFVFMNLRQVE